jgi:putative transposase
VVTPAARREAAAYLASAFDMSERRACQVIGVDRTSVRYRGSRSDDAVLRGRLKELAAERRRFGYRRLHVLLKREGHVVNRKRVQRLYREEKLTVRRRGGRKRAIGTRRPIETPVAANQRWSLDFLSDQLTDGRRFRIFAVVDDCTRECLALAADTSLSGLRVARELDDIVRRRGQPTTIVSDNGTEPKVGAASSPRTRSLAGQTRPASAGITSRPASHSRTASSRASTAGCGMNS